MCLHQQALPVQIDEYISAHLTEDIDAHTLCQEFQIGKTRLYEIVKQNYGTGLAEHVRNLRIEKAKVLLLDRLELSLKEIADLCGYKDYNYFITMFKRGVGIPPKQYAKKSTMKVERNSSLDRGHISHRCFFSMDFKKSFFNSCGL